MKQADQNYQYSMRFDSMVETFTNNRRFFFFFYGFSAFHSCSFHTSGYLVPNCHQRVEKLKATIPLFLNNLESGHFVGRKLPYTVVNSIHILMISFKPFLFFFFFFVKTKKQILFSLLSYLLRQRRIKLSLYLFFFSTSSSFISFEIHPIIWGQKSKINYFRK